jgi:UDP-N-acetylglucosamine--N-acetylmuramyl-(pentapeptide) pyrophosphoryl-undecaprenol N-acetylglucosamine transferase
MTRRIDLAAGGTGGHMFPAMALAAELEARDITATILCDRRGARYLGSGTAHRLVSAASPAGSPLQRLRGLARLALGGLQATSGLIRQRPDAVASFGGYASVPVALAARLLGIPLMVHEQNAVLGRANRLAVGHAGVLALSFARTSGVPASERRIDLVTGNPVRASVAAHADAAYEVPEHGGPIRVVVVGGSQGAKVLSDAVPEAIAGLDPTLRRRVELTQQCRPEDQERVRAAYEKIGFAATLAPFFADLPERLARAHLVISRSGASSVAELLVLGRPAVLVPYRHAADDHQRANAEALVEAGAAWMLGEEEMDGDRLGGLLTRLFTTPEDLALAASRARAMAPADAAAALAAALVRLADASPASDGRGALA